MSDHSAMLPGDEYSADQLRIELLKSFSPVVERRTQVKKTPDIQDQVIPDSMIQELLSLRTASLARSKMKKN